MKKKLFCGVLPLIPSFAIAIGMILIGFYSGIDVSKIVYYPLIVCLFMATLLIGVSFINAYRSKNSKNEKRSFEINYEKITKDINLAIKTFKKRVLLFRITLVVLFLILLSALFVCGASLVLDKASFAAKFNFVIPLVIIAHIIVIFIYLFKIIYNANLWDDKIVLKPKEFPLVYQLADKAAKAVGFSGKYKICASKLNEDAIYSCFNSYILIHPIMLKYWTKAELSSILIHTFARLKSGDVKLEKSFKPFEPEGSLSIIFNELINYLIPDLKDDNAGIIYESHRYWSNYSADKVLVDEDIKQNYVNAMAKYEIYNLKLFAGSSVNLKFVLGIDKEDYLDKFYNEIIDFSHKFKGKLEHIISNELQVKKFGVPKVNITMKNLGIESFDFMQTETDESYVNARVAICKAAEDIAYKLNNLPKKLLKNLSERMQEGLALIENYDENSREMDIMEILGVIENVNIIEPQKCQEILLKLLETNQNNAALIYSLACHYLSQLDEKCVEYFMQLKDNGDYSQEVCDYLETYASFMGDLQLYNKMDKEMTEFFDNEPEEFCSIKKFDINQYQGVDKNNDKIKKIIEYVHKNCNQINEIYCLTKNQNKHKRIILVLKASIKQNKFIEQEYSLREYLFMFNDNEKIEVVDGLIQCPNTSKVYRRKDLIIYSRKSNNQN